jgi:hypothetical protein
MVSRSTLLCLVGVCVSAVSCGGSSDETNFAQVRWSEAVAVGEGSVSGSPLAVMSPSGSATLLWNRYVGPGGVYAPTTARSSGVSTWSAAQELESAPATLQSVVLALAEAASQPTALWTKQDVQSPQLIRAARFGTTWSAAESLPANTATTQSSFAGSANGEVFGVWAEYDGSRYVVASAKRDGAGRWTRTPDLAATTATLDPQPVVAADASGNAVALWVEGAPTRIRASHLTAGQTMWSASVAIDSGSAPSSTPRIIWAGGGTFVAAWDQTLNSQPSVHAAHHSGQSWSSPTTLDSGNANGAIGAQLAGTGQGQAVAVWSRIEGGATSFWSAAFDVTGWRSPRQVIGPTNLGIRGGPVLAVDGSGHALVAWTLSGGASQAVEYSSADDLGNQWRPPLSVSMGSVEPTPPSLATNSNGQSVIAWIAVDGTRRSVQARIGQRP